MNNPQQLLQTLLQQQPNSFHIVQVNQETKTKSQNQLVFNTFGDAFQGVIPSLINNASEMNNLVSPNHRTPHQNTRPFTPTEAVLIHLSASLRRLSCSSIDSGLTVAQLYPMSNPKLSNDNNELQHDSVQTNQGHTVVTFPTNNHILHPTQESFPFSLDHWWLLAQLTTLAFPITTVASKFLPPQLLHLASPFSTPRRNPRNSNRNRNFRNFGDFRNPIQNKAHQFSGVLIGINGRSGSGKSTLAKKLFNAFVESGIAPEKICHISRDVTLIECYHPEPERVLAGRASWDSTSPEDYALAFSRYNKRVGPQEMRPGQVVNTRMRNKINAAIARGCIVMVDTLAMMFNGHSLSSKAKPENYDRFTTTDDGLPALAKHKQGVIYDGRYTLNALRIGLFISRNRPFAEDLVRHAMDIKTQLDIFGECNFPVSLPSKGTSYMIRESLTDGSTDTGIMNHASFVTSWEMTDMTVTHTVDGVRRVMPHLFGDN